MTSGALTSPFGKLVAAGGAEEESGGLGHGEDYNLPLACGDSNSGGIFLEGEFSTRVQKKRKGVKLRLELSHYCLWDMGICGGRITTG